MGSRTGNPAWQDSPSTATPITAARLEAIESAIDGSAPLASPVFTGDPKAPTPATGDNDTSVATTAFVKAQGYAPLASPALTGNPTAPTQTAGNDSTRLATTAFVQAASGLLVPKSLVDAKGDLIVGTADNTVSRLPVGSNGQVLTADSAQASGVKWATPSSGSSGKYAGVNNQTGTSYSVQVSDVGKLVVLNNGAGITVTVPSSLGAQGDQIDLVAWGAGMVTIVAGSGALVHGTPSLVTRAQYSAVTLIQVFADEWLAVGDLA